MTGLLRRHSSRCGSSTGQIVVTPEVDSEWSAFCAKLRLVISLPYNYTVYRGGHMNWFSICVAYAKGGRYEPRTPRQSL